MTQAELNIIIRVQAAQALAAFKSVQTELAATRAQLAATGATAGGALGMENALTGLRALGAQLQWTGRQLAQNFTMPIALLGGLMVHWEMQNETASANLKKTYGDLGMASDQLTSELHALDGAFIALSERYGQSKAIVTTIASDWSAAGASGLALAKNVDLTLQMMMIGNMDAQASTTALIAIQSQYGQTTDQLTNTIAKLNATENTTGLTFAGLVDAMARSAGAARSAGVDVSHLSALIAAITPAAGSASSAGDGLKTMFQKLTKPTADSAAVMRDLGVNTKDLAWINADAATKIEMLAGKFVGLNSAQRSVAEATIFGAWQINRASVLFTDINSAAGNYHKTLNLLAEDKNVYSILNKELQTAFSSNPQMMKQAGVIIKNSLTSAIVPLIPTIVYLAQSLGKVTKAFADMDPVTQKWIMAAFGLIAILGPILLLLGTLFLALSVLGKSFLWVGEKLLALARYLIAPTFKFATLTASIVSNTAAMILNSSVMVATGGAIRLVVNGLIWLGASYLLLVVQLAQAVAAQIAWSIAFVLRNGIVVSSTVTMAWAVALSHTVMGATINAVTVAWTTANTALVVAYNYAVATLAAMRSAAILAWEATTNAIWIAYIETRMAFGRALETAYSLWLATTAMARLAFIEAFEVARSVVETVGHNIRYAAGVAAGMAMFAVDKVVAAARLAYAAAVNIAHLVLTTNFFEALAGISLIGWVRTSAIWAAGALGSFGTLGGMLTGVVALFKSFFVRLIPMVMAGSAALFDAMTGPIGWAITAIIALIVIFWDQISQFISGFLGYFQNLPAGVKNAFDPIFDMFNSLGRFILSVFNMLPEGIKNALMAVVHIVESAAKQVYQLFSYMNPFARHSPSLVENVTEGMKAVGEQFGLASLNIQGSIMNAYAAMQVFGASVAQFKNQVSSIKNAEDRSNISSTSGSGAVGAYDALSASIADLTWKLDAVGQVVEEQQVRVLKLAAAVKDADANIKDMNSTLDGFKSNLESATASLDAAKASYDYFANAPITGMKAMSDQIFANIMAQKALELQIARLSDSGTTSIGSVTDAYAKLQGQIELMLGAETELRNKGAGSDITGQYDLMIADLRRQQQDLLAGVGGGPSTQIDALNAQLEALKNTANKLDLEQSLRFDPLTRQIKDFRAGLDELPFDQIMAGMQSSGSQVDIYTAQVKSVSDAVKIQEAAIKSAQEARDGTSATYDRENEKLTQLKSIYSDIKTVIDDATKALNDMTTAAESSVNATIAAAKAAATAAAGTGKLGGPGEQAFNAAADATGWSDPGGNSAIGREGGTGDQSAQIEQFASDMANQTAASLGGFDMFGGIKDKWNSFKSWWNDNVVAGIVQLVDAIGAGFSNIGNPFSGIQVDGGGFIGWLKTAGTNIADFASDAGRLLGPELSKTISYVGSGFSDIWNNAKPALSNIGGALSDLAKSVGGGFSALRPAFDELLDVSKKMWPVVKAIGDGAVAIIKVVWDMLNGLIRPVFSFIGDTFRYIVDMVAGIIRVVAGAIQFFVSLGKAVADLFHGDWGGYTRAMRAALDGIIEMWRGLVGILGALMHEIGAVFSNGWNAIFGFVKGFVMGIIDAFKWLYDVIVGHSIIPDLVNAIVSWFSFLPKWVMEHVLAFVNVVVTFIGELPGKVFDALKSLGSFLGNAFMDAFHYLESILPVVASAALNVFTEMPGRIWGLLRSLGSFLGNAFTDAFHYLESILPTVVNGALSVFTYMPRKIWELLGDLGGVIGGKFSDAFSYLSGKLPSLARGVFDFFIGLPKAILGYLGDGAKWLLKVGEDAVQGLMDGIKSKASDLKDSVLTLVRDFIMGPIDWILDRHSPSKVMQQVGNDIGQGVVNGINEKGPGVQQASQDLANQTTNINVPASPVANSFDHIGTSAANARTQADNAHAALTGYFTALNAGQDATLAYQKTQEALNTAWQTFRDKMEAAGTAVFTAQGQIDLGTQAGRDLYAQLKTVQTAYADAGTAAYQAEFLRTGSEQAAAAAADAATAVIVRGLRDQLTAMGFNGAQMDAILAQLGNFGRTDWRNMVNLDTNQANRNIDQIEGRLRALQNLTLLLTGNGIDAVPGGRTGAAYPALPGVGPRAGGGWITGPGTTTSDSILGVNRQGIPTSLVSNDEFVVNAADAAKHKKLLELMNAGQLPAFAAGGTVGGTTTTSSSTTANTATIDIVKQVTDTTDKALKVWTDFSTKIIANVTDMALMFTTKFDKLDRDLFDAWTLMSVQSNTIFMQIRDDSILHTLEGHDQILALDVDLRDVSIIHTQEMHDQIIARVIDQVAVMILWFTTMRDTLGVRMMETRDTSSILFQGMSNNFANTFDKFIQPTFDRFFPMLQTVEGWFAGTVGNIGRIWMGMQEATAVPARFIVNQVYNAGIKEAWNKVNGWLNLPPLDNFVAGFATGGPVFGAGTSTSDSIPALLSNQEHVVTAREVEGAGGHAAVEAQRKEWRNGASLSLPSIGRLGRYAFGGPVDSSIWEAVHSAFPNAMHNSEFRPGDSGFHGKAEAVDVTGPMQQIANWAVQSMQGKLAQVIYGPGPLLYNVRGQNITDQAQLRGVYAGDLAGHYDHVHIAAERVIEGFGGMVSDAFGSAGGASSFSMGDTVMSTFRSIMDPIAGQIGGNLSGVNMIRKSGFDQFNKVGDFLKSKGDAMSASSGGRTGAGVVDTGPGSPYEIFWRTAAQFGWDKPPFRAPLDSLEMQESGYRPTIQNPTSTAYGMGQFLDATWDGYGPKTSDAGLQSLYMMRYIKDRYIDPIVARKHEDDFNWYDEGGYMMPGVGVYKNNTGSPEPVFSPTQWQTLQGAVNSVLSGGGVNAELAKNINTELSPTLKNIGIDFGKVNAWTMADLDKGINDEFNKIVAPIASGMDQAAKDITNEVNGVITAVVAQAPEWKKNLDAVGIEVGKQVEALAPVFQTAVTDLTPAFTAELTKIGPSFGSAVSNWNTDPAGALAKLGPVFQTIFNDLAPTVGAEIAKLQPTFNSADAAAAVASSVTAGSSLDSRYATAAATVTPGNTTIQNDNSTTNIVINGNLSFPSITSTDGAEAFISNLKTRAGVS